MLYTNTEDNSVLERSYSLPLKRKHENQENCNTKIPKSYSYDSSESRDWLKMINRIDNLPCHSEQLEFEKSTDDSKNNDNFTEFVNYECYWTADQKRDLLYLMVAILLNLNQNPDLQCQIVPKCRKYQDIVIKSIPCDADVKCRDKVVKILHGLYLQKQNKELSVYINRTKYPAFMELQKNFRDLQNPLSPCGIYSIQTIEHYYQHYEYLRPNIILLICQFLRTSKNSIFEVIQMLSKKFSFNIKLLKAILCVLYLDMKLDNTGIIQICLKKWVEEGYGNIIIKMLVRNFKIKSFPAKQSVIKIFTLLMRIQIPELLKMQMKICIQNNYKNLLYYCKDDLSLFFQTANHI